MTTNASRQLIGTLTTSLRLDTPPHNLASALKDPRLSRPAVADRQRQCTVAIHLSPVAQGCGSVTFHCFAAGISERRQLQTRQLSTWDLLAETVDTSDSGTSKAPAFAVQFNLTPLLQPGGIIATRVSLSFRFVREAWWISMMETALADLADLWLRRLADQIRLTA